MNKGLARKSNQPKSIIFSKDTLYVLSLSLSFGPTYKINLFSALPPTDVYYSPVDRSPISEVLTTAFKFSLITGMRAAIKYLF